MSEKKRKRRSFWEPDSEKLVAWLDAQTDLGTSLQLIIVDAIHKYGEGDVIKAHLNQRENFYYDTEPQTPVRKPAQTKAVVQPEPSIKDEDDKPLPPHIPEPEDHEDSGEDLELESDSELELEPEAEDESPFDIANIMGSDTEEDGEDDKEPEYNPIDIMMNDIGSTLRK